MIRSAQVPRGVVGVGVLDGQHGQPLRAPDAAGRLLHLPHVPRLGAGGAGLRRRCESAGRARRARGSGERLVFRTVRPERRSSCAAL